MYQTGYTPASSSYDQQQTQQQMIYNNASYYPCAETENGYHCYNAATSNGQNSLADMQCYSYSQDFPDINALEPTIWTQHMVAPPDQPPQQQQPNFGPVPVSAAQQQTGGMFGGIYHHNSPTGSSHTSTGSDESDDYYGWHPYKRSPPAVLEIEPRGKRAKQTKKRKPRKDPNEPQKPVSAYALFFRDTQAAIKGQNPNASFGEVSKIVASMWDALGVDAKNAYKQKTESAKKDYLKQLAAYRANLLSKSGNNPGVMDSLGHMDLGQSPNKFMGAPVGSPDSTTMSIANDNTTKDLLSELGGKSLASLIAEPAPHQVLTATTTLTVPQSYIPVRSKSEYEEPDFCSEGQSLNLRTNGQSQMTDNWDREFRPNEGLVPFCRDVVNLWGQSGQQAPLNPSGSQQTGYTPV